MGADELAANAVVTASIVNDAIDGTKIADDVINSEHYVDGSIDTAHIADNQITLAKLAGGTDGNLISYDANGDPVAVATGNSGQVLTTAGAGATNICNSFRFLGRNSNNRFKHGWYSRRI